MFCAYCFCPLGEDFITRTLYTGDSDPVCFSSPDELHHLEYLPSTIKAEEEAIATEIAAEIERQKIMSVLDSTVITYAEIQAALNEAPPVTFEVYSTSRNAVLGAGFATRESADAYIADNDYNPYTVSTRQVAGSGGSVLQASLRELNQIARENFRGWNASNPDARLVREDALDGKYLRKEYRTRGLKVANSPYKFINWDEAAQFVKGRYNSVVFGAYRYWLRTMTPVNDGRVEPF